MGKIPILMTFHDHIIGDEDDEEGSQINEDECTCDEYSDDFDYISERA